MSGPSSHPRLRIDLPGLDRLLTAAESDVDPPRFHMAALYDIWSVTYDRPEEPTEYDMGVEFAGWAGWPKVVAGAANADRVTLDLTAPSEWHAALRASGPDLTEFAHLKLAHEAQERAAEPEHLIELADVLICAAALMLRNGWTAAQVNAAIEKKTAINKARTWERMPDGTWQHRK